ncbi:hypothetical protein [Nonomuraea sp. CA-141351]|uniref:hypothetical protein n=1 Tax=Nonomuraea sp. CA-141351 TaxID=3239996 RepID=UPI003D8EC5AA
MRVKAFDHLVLNVPGSIPASSPCWRGRLARFGARGEAQSVYVKDPDGNTVELRWYPQDTGR